MDLYNTLVGFYDTFLNVFPQPLQWLVTLLLLIGLVAAFFNLIRHNAIFLIILIVLLPFLIPLLQHFFRDVYNFFLYLLTQLKTTAPGR